MVVSQPRSSAPHVSGACTTGRVGDKSRPRALCDIYPVQIHRLLRAGGTRKQEATRSSGQRGGRAFGDAELGVQGGKACGGALREIAHGSGKVGALISPYSARLMVYHSLLKDIHRFVDKEQESGFFRSLVDKDARVAKIENFYRRIGMTLSAFQVRLRRFCRCAFLIVSYRFSCWILGMLNIQSMPRNNEAARIEDTNMLNERLKSLERSQADLRKTLGPSSPFES